MPVLLPRRGAVLALTVMLASLVLGTAAQQPRDESIALTVDASRAGARIDRNIFGQFAEHLGKGIYEGVWVGPDSPIPNTRGIRNDVVAALKALKVPNVRWPGGCFADEYHWRKGIGPLASRPATLNPNWGDVIEPNTFGTHEFMDFIEQIGSEAYLSINVGSGTPQEAAEWLEYLTSAQPTALAKERAANGHPAPYKIAYLGIGNENWDCGGNMSAEYYLQQMKIAQPLRPQLQSGAAEGGRPDVEDRGRPRRRWSALDRVDRDDHAGLQDPSVELGHARPLAAQLHRGAVPGRLQVGGLRRGRLRAAAVRDAEDGRT